MARRRAASQQMRTVASRRQPAPIGGPSPARRLPGVKVLLFGIVVVSLVGFVAVALSRELAAGSRAAPDAASARPVVPTPRPALTAEEDSYAKALWPIHNDVKASALKMSMAGIQYKVGRLDPGGLKAQVEASFETYRQAEGEMLALRPPASLQAVHDDYLNAVRLYQQSALEMVKLYDDQRDDHLIAAFPMSQEGGRALRRVGAVLWPSEYVPS
jgi:hypothetical protein